jgi:SWIM zinc finger
VAEHSVSPPAVPSTPQELLAERVEAELDRLRVARPALADRLDRAAGILLLQLSSPPRLRPVRVRVGAAGARFLVSSVTARGCVYVVDPRSWSCSCPDWHRRDGTSPCKHGLAAFILWRAGRRQEEKGCERCYRGWVFLGEQVVDRDSGEVVEAYNPVPCRHCRGDDKPPYMSDDELAEWMGHSRWIYAVTMPKHPHEYTLRREQDEETFLRVVKTIWDKGFDRSYLRRPWRSLDVGNYYVWVHTQPELGKEAPLSETILINRAERLQEKLA